VDAWAEVVEQVGFVAVLKGAGTSRPQSKTACSRILQLEPNYEVLQRLLLQQNVSP
jgi:hypothetical protein